jgi:flagellar hook-associated protein 1 FlgK
MAGLFDTLALGSRSLTTYRKAIDTTGHNLSNVHTPGYTRQRLEIESTTVDGGTQGSIGTGSDSVRVTRLQNEFAERQIQVEVSVEGSLSTRHEAMQQALTSLQESINRGGATGTTTNGISQGLSEFFNAAQGLTTNPDSIPDRQVLLQKAQELATKFNTVDGRLASLTESVNEQIQFEVGKANSLTTEIANLNAAIVSEEALSEGYANDLRDSRQAKMEELSKLVKIEATEQADGSMNISVAGNLLVDGRDLVNTLETFTPAPLDPADGNLMVRVTGQPDALALTGGSIEGAISVREGQLATLRTEINTLAETLISEVNLAHSTGFGLTGTTGANFFTGTNASDIAVNSALLREPALLQASAASGEVEDNTIARAIAELESKANAALDGQTFSGKQAQTVAWLGQEVSNARSELQDQSTISQFIRQQRDSVSGVSVDEEMTNLVMFQKAFQASAKLISMADEMLETLIQM